MDEDVERGRSQDGDDEDDNGNGLRPGYKPWGQFNAPGQLKKDVEEAWERVSDKSCPYDVVITVVGNNPLSGYSVSLNPTG